MESLDQQFRQLKENYEHMTEGQLCALAEEAYDLTEIAREALQVVIMEKGVDIPLKMDPLALPPEHEDLVIFGWPRGAEAAGRAMKTLAAAGIPSFLSLEVRADDVERADAALYPVEEGDDQEGKKDYAVLCPKCHSAKIVLEGRDSKLADPSPTVKFQWSCDACGHRWVDDGIAQEAAGGQSWPGEEFPTSEEQDWK